MPLDLEPTFAPEQLLAEVEDVLRTVPARATIRHPEPENYAWLGRAAAVIAAWDPLQGPLFDIHVQKLTSQMAVGAESGIQGVMVMLNRARFDLAMKTTGPKSVAISAGQVFDYFDELRKAIEPARNDLFFVDRYLDADFVARYLPHVHLDASVRLLTTPEALPKLLPAVEAFCAQTGLKVSVRTCKDTHDRYVIVDQASCYQSGASFKDGARKHPTTLTQIVDAFAPVLDTYEKLWAAATVVR
jgi:hypothetical protein